MIATELNEKKLKKILEAQNKELQHYMGVLIEHSDSKTELIAESLLGVQDQLKAIREMVAKNTEDIEMMRMDLHIMRSDVKENINRNEFNVLEKRIGNIERKLTIKYK